MELNNGKQSFNDLSKNAQEEINRTLTRENLIVEIETDLKTNPRYKNFFDQYHPRSVESFINNYKSTKASWIMWGNLYASMEQEKILKYSQIAFEKLWEIQQKKLFNLQCQWRAEAIQIPGIETTHDFTYWARLISQCPFIPPVSQNEFELYLDYILSDNFEIDDMHSSEWQDYDRYKDEYTGNDNGSSIPEWYQFYDSRMGTGGLLTLPDVRGDKEDFYIKLFLENDRKVNAQKYIYKEDPDKRPQLVYYDEKVIEEFIEMFEDTNIKDYSRAMKSNVYESIEFDSKLHQSLEILNQVGNIELEYAGNWRDSILLTVRKYEQKEIYKAFLRVYKNYINRLNMGIEIERTKTEEDMETTNYLINLFKDQILKGRVLNGEPEDFNF